LRNLSQDIPYDDHKDFRNASFAGGIKPEEGWGGGAAEAETPIPVQLSQGLAVDVRPRWPELVLDLGK
jgi:hypothetical protein